jgi:tryptophanyl-tRNA synthetase
MSLRDATKKMSKSEESDYSRINLKDSADEINKKIKKANQTLYPFLKV